MLHFDTLIPDKELCAFFTLFRLSLVIQQQFVQNQSIMAFLLAVAEQAFVSSVKELERALCSQL